MEKIRDTIVIQKRYEESLEEAYKLNIELPIKEMVAVEEFEKREIEKE